MGSKYKAQRAALVISVVGGLVAIVLVVKYTPRPAPPRHVMEVATEPEVYGTIPDFSLVDQNAKPFGKTQLLGKISIADFIFTRCRTVCPLITSKMMNISESTSKDIQLISFSVDPEYDTPDRLAAYARERGIKSERWHFLTGDADAVQATVQDALKIAMDKEGVSEDGIPNIVHGGHFVLFDAQGRIRGYYNSEDAGRIQAVIRDATQLAVQVSPE